MASEANAPAQESGQAQEKEHQVGDEYANSRSFDLHKTSQYPEVDDLVDELYSNIPYDRRPKGAKERHAKQCLKTVLVNLFDVYNVDPARWIGYSRRPAWYSGIPARYNKLEIKWPGLKRIIDSLLRLGYIDHKKGFRSQTSYMQGRLSRMRACPKLIELMKQAGIKSHMVERVNDEEIIILRARKEKGERKGKEIDYEDTAETIQMRQNLRIINSQLQDHRVDIYVSDEDLKQINIELNRKKDSLPFEPGRKRLRRIFNNSSFKSGGRFYGGWWQEIPKKWRPFIVIDNRPTCEIDFSGMHIGMLYANTGVPIPDDDPYLLPGCSKKVRNFLKASFNTIINARTKDEAVNAIKREQAGLALPPDYPDIESLIVAFAEKHEPIRHLFYSGEGIKLQRTDSDIAEHVMLELGKEGIVALPVHDSFIVEEQHEDKLRDAMYNAFEVKCGVEIDIKMQQRLTDVTVSQSNLEKLNSGDPEHIRKYSGYYRRDLEFMREL